MNPEHSKLRQQNVPTSQNSTEAELAKRPLEFATPEELLRFDAVHTPVPSSLPERLDNSLAALKPARKPWWKRLFG